jgi:aldehyde dehydrogenase (NAD+)
MYIGMNYVGGEFQPHRPDFPSINPSTEEDIGLFPTTTSDEVVHAVSVARKASSSWASLSRIQRAEYFDTLAQIVKRDIQKIARAISLETGKTLNESRAEVNEALHMAQYTFAKGREAFGECVASELAERDAYVWRKPKGVVAVVAPWNFPFAIGGFWCAAPALLEGNTVVYKPSEDTPMVGQITAELYDEANFPDGVFNVIHGDGEVGNALVLDDVDHICFTGSMEVGRTIRRVCADSWYKTCSCEMGSKSALIVFNDADLELALSAAVASAFKLSGQRCVSASRILVQRSVYDTFCSEFVQLASQVKIGDPFNMPNALFGPLINKNQMERVLRYNNIVNTDEDCKVLLAGEKMNGKGYYLTPHVYQTEWADKPFLKQEVFGPHVALVPFDTLDEAIEIYNDTNYGLAVGVLTNDYRNMRECRNRCDYGMIYFNLGCIGAESHMPFGGVKGSGNGWTSAAGTFEAVTHKVAVNVNHGKTLNFPQGLK